MNSDYNKDFITACNLAENEYSHCELIELLKNGNVPEKQFSVIMLENLNDENEAELLVKNLTGCDGKIREAVALKINTFLNSFDKYFTFFAKEKFAKIFADATIDINANICRLVIDSVATLRNNDKFLKAYSANIVEFIYQAFEKLDSFIYKDRKYVINKQLFKLYWCLESLKLFYNEMDSEILKLILERSAKENEYTIREKVAQIVEMINKSEYESIVKQLKQDENYYVKSVFNK